MKKNITNTLLVMLFCLSLNGQNPMSSTIFGKPYLTEKGLNVKINFETDIYGNGLGTNRNFSPEFYLLDSISKPLVSVKGIYSRGSSNNQVIVCFPYENIFPIQDIDYSTNLTGIKIKVKNRDDSYSEVSVNGIDNFDKLNKDSLKSNIYDHVVKRTLSSLISIDNKKYVYSLDESKKQSIATDFFDQYPEKLISLKPENRIAFIKENSKKNVVETISSLDSISLLYALSKIDSVAPDFFNAMVLRKLENKEPTKNSTIESELDILIGVLTTISLDKDSLLAVKLLRKMPPDILDALSSIQILKHPQIVLNNFEKLNKEVQNQIARDYYLKNIDSIRNLKDHFPNYLLREIITDFHQENSGITQINDLLEILKNDSILVKHHVASTQNLQNPITINVEKDTIIQNLSFNYINDKKSDDYNSYIKEISPYNKKTEKIDMGINVSINVDSLSNKLSHYINYFNMDKYYGIGGTFYGPFYGNQFSFNFITRIDSGYPLQPLVVGNIETYWTNGVNGDFGIVLNNLSEKGFLQTCNVGIYTGAEFINNKKFFKNTSFDTYYDWEIGLSCSKRFKIDEVSKTWQEFNLRIPVTYRYLLGDSDKHHTFFSPQVTLSYNWDKVFIQSGCQFHLLGNKTLPISNGSFWVKIYYKLNRNQ